jgi:hypothetical protein
LISNDASLYNYVNTTYGVLPIELSSFSAVTNNMEATLAWTTASELNNDYFILEKSLDGVIFHPIATIEGSGTSNSNLEYSYVDQQPILGRSYYRISQVDYSGNITIHNIIKLEYFDNDLIKLYPNPATEYLYTNIDLSKFSVAIQNSQGISQPGLAEIINGTPAINLTHLDNGVYFLKLVDQKELSTKLFRFIKR